MHSGRQIQHAVPQENPLWLSWHDTQTMATLTPQTVMDYFCRKSNPFYDHLCNNETIRMQRLGMEHLNNMIGLEYILLHVAEPILYVIRKQHRHTPTEATPIADYYIIGGMVYKAPDLGNVINSRILSTVINLQAAFEEANSYSRYHPNKGYTWDFSSNKALSDKYKTACKKDKNAAKDDTGTVFQMQRVDMLLGELLRKFPPPIPPILQQQQQQQAQQQQTQQQQGGVEASTSDQSTASASSNATAEPNTTSTATSTQVQATTVEPKSENVDMKPPPEKKTKI